LLKRAMELEPVLLEEFTKPGAELTAEAPAKRLNGQEEAWRGIDPSGTVKGQTAGGNDVVNMGMMLEVLSPGMEHAEKTDVRSQVLGVTSQFEHRRGASAVEQVVQQPLVLQCESGRANAASVKTTWKYGTGNSSAERASSHFAARSPGTWGSADCGMS